MILTKQTKNEAKDVFQRWDKGAKFNAQGRIEKPQQKPVPTGTPSAKEAGTGNRKLPRKW